MTAATADKIMEKFLWLLHTMGARYDCGYYMEWSCSGISASILHLIKHRVDPYTRAILLVVRAACGNDMQI
jgi:hypothetical protein